MTKRNIRLWIRRNAVLAPALLSILAFHLLSASAQTSADGSIYGHVTDNSGAALVGVQLTAHSPAVGGTFKAVTDDQGNYRLLELPPADDYTLEAENSGFEKFIRVGLIVRAGLNVTVDIPLKIGSQAQTVQVSGDAPLIDTQSSEQAVNLSGELLRSIPITGRHD